jgi:NAD(P)-dependent dehydrogenase (short-subunit alcohol dehydrogenase family)
MATTKRIALVTGASRGLGATLARLLAEGDYDLLLSARTQRDLERVGGELRQNGATVITRHGDLADPFTRHTLIDAARYLGGLDLLVNNASELGGLAPLIDIEPLRFEHLMRVNVIAPVTLLRDAVPLLAERGGLAVNISSDAAQGAYPGWGAYGATKAALDLASRTLAAELAPARIGVVLVDPGDLRTRMQQEAFPGKDISDRPLPDVTRPFFEWLFNQDPMSVTGRRFQAQQEKERWLVGA